MMTNLDDVIKQRAKIYADRPTLEAPKAKKDEEIRIASEHSISAPRRGTAIQMRSFFVHEKAPSMWKSN
jgi:hypothetical protein